MVINRLRLGTSSDLASLSPPIHTVRKKSSGDVRETSVYNERKDSKEECERIQVYGWPSCLDIWVGSTHLEDVTGVKSPWRGSFEIACVQLIASSSTSNLSVLFGGITGG